MNIKKFKLPSWNVRGLGNLDKCLVVRKVLREACVDVVCLQETKWNTLDFNYVSSAFPSFLNNSVYIPELLGLQEAI